LLGPIGAGSGGIRAYQGSPHDFAAERLVRYPDGRTEYIVGRPDVLPDVPAGAEVLRDFPMGRMRMDKIGTGEGAQAYGHGLYTAEAEEVARGYRDALSKGAFNNATFDGVPISDLPDELRRKLNYHFGATTSIEDALDMHRSSVERYLKEAGGDVTNPIYLDELAQLRWAEEAASKLQMPSGRMYEVNIRANPEDFLDWDKPFAEQPSRVQQAIIDQWRSLGGTIEGRTLPPFASRPDASMESILAAMSTSQPSRAAGIVEGKLREASIPGIRYLDAGSRGVGDGSRNYVIFDENLIEIVRKYGIAGAAALLGLSVADIEAAMAAPAPDGLLAQEPRQ